VLSSSLLGEMLIWFSGDSIKTKNVKKHNPYQILTGTQTIITQIVSAENDLCHRHPIKEELVCQL
jgi:hypothetical protein